MVDIMCFSWERKGKRFFHKPEWVNVKDHPRGGEARFAFILESEEWKVLEMCLTCNARRINPEETK